MTANKSSEKAMRLPLMKEGLRKPWPATWHSQLHRPYETTLLTLEWNRYGKKDKRFFYNFGQDVLTLIKNQGQLSLKTGLKGHDVRQIEKLRQTNNESDKWEKSSQ